MNVDSRSRLRLWVVSVFTLLFLFSGNSVPAQTPEPAKPTSEVEQLKQRLQQLEQVVSDLKGQISAIEETKAKTSAPAAVIDAKYSETTSETTQTASAATRASCIRSQRSDQRD